MFPFPFWSCKLSGYAQTYADKFMIYVILQCVGATGYDALWLHLAVISMNMMFCCESSRCSTAFKCNSDTS